MPLLVMTLAFVLIGILSLLACVRSSQRSGLLDRADWELNSPATNDPPLQRSA